MLWSSRSTSGMNSRNAANLVVISAFRAITVSESITRGPPAHIVRNHKGTDRYPVLPAGMWERKRAAERHGRQMWHRADPESRCGLGTWEPS